MKNRHREFETRQTMNNETLEIFHYQDARMTTVPIHQHDFCEIYYFVSGNVTYRTENFRLNLKPGSLLLIKPHHFHQPLISPDLPYERYVLWINEDYLSRLIPEDIESECFLNGINLLMPNYTSGAKLSELLLSLSALSDLKDPASELEKEGLLLQFLSLVYRLSEKEKESAPEQGERSTVISSLLSYLSTHYIEPLSLDELSKQFFVSKYYLSHLFKETVGTSIYHYVTEKRLLYAEELLKNGVSPKDAALQSGFTDYSVFYRAFKAEYAVSPGKFRK